MKKDLLAWNTSVDASFAGRDYPEGRVTPADPESVFWYETPAYQPYLEQWKDRWEFKSTLQNKAQRRSVERRSKRIDQLRGATA